jgi:hypothetical protein
MARHHIGHFVYVDGMQQPTGNSPSRHPARRQLADKPLVLC